MTKIVLLVIVTLYITSPASGQQERSTTAPPHSKVGTMKVRKVKEPQSDDILVIEKDTSYFQKMEVIPIRHKVPGKKGKNAYKEAIEKSEDIAF